MKLKIALYTLAGLVALIMLPVLAGVLVGLCSVQQAPQPVMKIRYVDAPASHSGR